jgi:hypothetical protein
MEPIRVYPDKFKGKDIEAPEGSVRFKYIYMHGEAERKSGYDCCNMDSLPAYGGIYPAVIVWPNGKEDKAKLLFKPRDMGQRGLIVADDDPIGYREAKGWYDKV